MNLQALVTTIVAGILALAMFVGIVALLISSVDVPVEFIPALLMLIGVAVGGANKASG